MSFTLGQIALVVGKQFTVSQLDAINDLLAKQPAIPANLFMDDPSGVLLGPGMSMFTIVRNCQSDEMKQDLINYWLRKFRLGKAENVWEEMVMSVADKKQCFAMSLFHSEVCKVVGYKDRRDFALGILKSAIPIAETKQKKSAEYLD